MARQRYTDNFHTQNQHCELTGKRCFSSKQDARNALVGQLASKAVRAYWCDDCHSYHITKEFKND